MPTPSPASSSPVREGEVVAAKYRIEQVLGAGGMGVVVAAQDLVLGRRVALKFLLPGAHGNARAVKRFLREACAAVQLRGEHVVRVFDVGELANGAPYMVMEFLKGHDLRKHLELRGALPVGEAVDYVLQACVAIAEAHTLGIVHRDLKPSNLFLTTRPDGAPWIKVFDFGVAKALRTAAIALHHDTTTRTVMGSPGYMAPEQMRRNRPIDTRTDIWALGVVLFELLTARLPFEGPEHERSKSDGYAALCLRIQVEPPASLRKFRPDAPPALEAVILRCLEKDPVWRWSSVAELARALSPFASRRSQGLIHQIVQIVGVAASHGKGPAPGPQQSRPIRTATDWERRPARAPKGVVLPIVGGVVLVGGLGVLAASTTLRACGSKGAPVPSVATESPTQSVAAESTRAVADAASPATSSDH